LEKIIRATQDYGARSVILAGGVSANKSLRQTLSGQIKKIKTGQAIATTRLKIHGDNAAMIALAAVVQTNLKPAKLNLNSLSKLSARANWDYGDRVVTKANPRYNQITKNH